MTDADRVWNRAALDSGGGSSHPGDRALASVLLVHGLVMNGGVHHALESIGPDAIDRAIEGYSFFGLNDVAAFFSAADSDPVLSVWTEDTETIANQRYAAMVPDDSSLVARFEEVFRKHGDLFAPIDRA